MIRREAGRSGVKVAPIVLGSNVFGWTVDQKQSFRLLDAFVDHGLNAIDTAAAYTAWVPGNRGGESEATIGAWLRARPGMRERVVIFTKGGCGDDGNAAPRGLSPASIFREAEQSLARLGTDYIDVYFSHYPDPDTEISQTLEAYDLLMRRGRIRAIGASNFSYAQLAAALQASARAGLPRYEVVQPEYNLVARSGFESSLQPLCLREGLGVVNYYGLAAGFLTGKYRSSDDFGKSVRGARMSRHMTPRGLTILDALAEVSQQHGCEMGEVALAWLLSRPAVTAPIASATKISHVESFARAASLSLTADDLAFLERASAEI